MSKVAGRCNVETSTFDRRDGGLFRTASFCNGMHPTNVPATALKLQARYAVAGLSPGAALQGEGNRMVLPDNTVRIPGFTSVDAGLRLVQRSSAGKLTWRAGIDNLFDRRAWRGSPCECSHAYPLPLAPRTLRISVQVDL